MINKLIFFICFISIINISYGESLLCNMRIIDSSIELTWQSETGEWYRVLTKTDLCKSIDSISSPLIASNTIETVSLPIGDSTYNNFYNILYEPIGSMIITNYDIVQNQSLLAIVRPEETRYPIEMFVLMDITDGETNIIDVVFGTNITEGVFSVDTSELPNGERQLVVVAYDGLIATIGYRSNPITITVDNKIFLAPNYATVSGWKTVVKFGTRSLEGEYLVKISKIYNNTTNLYGSVSGLLSEADTNGYITIEDRFIWDESANNYRLRNPYDEYDEVESFEIEITVNSSLAVPPTWPPTKVKYRVLPSRPLKWRISSVIEDTKAFNFPDGSSSRTLINGLFDVWFMGLGYISLHWDFIRLQRTSDHTPATQGWTRFGDELGWTKFAHTLARSSNVPPNHPYISHLYLLMHGNHTGVGDAISGRGIGHEVTSSILNGLGFSKTNGLTFAFFDACSVFSNGAALPTLLMKNNGVDGHISVDDMFEKGIYPNFGCGWTVPKMTAFANRVYVEHVTYSSDFAKWAIYPSLTTGLPLYSYKDARKEANKSNIGSYYYEYVGMEDAFIHW